MQYCMPSDKPVFTVIPAYVVFQGYQPFIYSRCQWNIQSWTTEVSSRWGNCIPWGSLQAQITAEIPEMQIRSPYLALATFSDFGKKLYCCPNLIYRIFNHSSSEDGAEFNLVAPPVALLCKTLSAIQPANQQMVSVMVLPQSSKGGEEEMWWHFAFAFGHLLFKIITGTTRLFQKPPIPPH